MNKKILPLLLTSVLLQGCAVAVLGGVAGGSVIATDNRSLKTQLDDTNDGFEISSALSSHEDLNNQTHVSAYVMNNKVLLVGQSPNSMLRNKAAKVVQDLNVADKVYNQIRLGNPTSFTTRSNDSWITTKVKGRMLNDKDLNSLRVKVVTENGEVFLLGVLDKPQGEIAVQIARTTTGVRKVVKVFDYVAD